MYSDVQPSVLGSLFDFSFSSFLSTRLVKLLYALSMVGIAFIALSLVVVGFQAGAGTGILTLLVVVPIATLIMLAYARILMELMIVLFRIAENVQILADQVEADTYAEER